MCYTMRAEGVRGFCLPTEIRRLVNRDSLSKSSAKQDGGFLFKEHKMKNHRSLTYRRRWQELIEYYGPRCFYCRKEIATTIDHVVPYSWDQDNQIENLVPACSLCNSLASNKHFESVEHKRQYILSQRKTRRNMRAICVNCLLPFTYRTHSPSFLLCAECYDEEYGTKESQCCEWKKWLIQLRAAGIPAEAHRAMKKRTDGKVKRSDTDARMEVLIDEYAHIVGTDDDFAASLMIT